MISESVSNWVDRGESAQLTTAKVLRHFFGLGAPVEDDRVRDYADTGVGVVAADASEVPEQADTFIDHLLSISDQQASRTAEALSHNSSPTYLDGRKL